MISKELQEVMAAIERLNPEWMISEDGDRIYFSKDTEDGTYTAGIRIWDSTEDCGRQIDIGINLSNLGKNTQLFLERYTEGVVEEFKSLEYYKKSRVTEIRQRVREEREAAMTKFLGRKT